MDVEYTLNGFDFIWDKEKARFNMKKHGISFEKACEVFFDPFYLWEDASRDDEERWGLQVIRKTETCFMLCPLKKAKTHGESYLQERQ